MAPSARAAPPRRCRARAGLGARCLPQPSPAAPRCPCVPSSRATERWAPAVLRRHVAKAGGQSAVTSCPCAPSCPVPGTAPLPCDPAAFCSSLRGWGAPAARGPPAVGTPSAASRLGVYRQIPVPVPSPRLARDVAGDVAGDALRWQGWSSSLGV